MTKGGSKKMKIKVPTATGNPVEIMDENNNAATPVTQAEMDQIYQGSGFTYVGTILHAETSPGCVYIIYRGKCFKICS
jgi:hypothetical protein